MRDYLGGHHAVKWSFLSDRSIAIIFDGFLSNLLQSMLVDLRALSLYFILLINDIHSFAEDTLLSSSFAFVSMAIPTAISHSNEATKALFSSII